MNQTLYDQAKQADAKFQAECVRQFGKAAGENRYISELHDARTSYARRAYHEAMELLRESWDGGQK